MSNQPAEIPLSALLSFWGSHAGDKVLFSFFLLPSPLTQMWYGWPQCLLQRRALSDSLHCLRRCNSDGSAGWRFGVSELVVRRRSQKTRFWEAWIATATNLHHVVVFVLSRRWCVTFLFFAVEGDCVLFFYCQMFRWSVFESVVKGQRYNKAKNSLGNCAKTGSQNGWLTTWCTSVVVKLGSTDSWDQHSFPLHIHLGSWYACLKISLTTLLCLQPFSGRNSPLTSVSPKRRSGPEFIPVPFLKMSLTSLPLLPLEKIASYLDFSSLVSLAASTSSLAHFQPKEQLVKGEDFSVAGFDPDGIWDHDTNGQVYGPEPKPPEPEPYFDVEVKTRGLLGIKLVWEW